MGDFSGVTRTKVKLWINDAYNIIWDQVGGLFKEKTSYLTTSDNYESTSVITVTATNGSGTVTSDGSANTEFAATMVDKYIQINSTDPWYRIQTYTSPLEIILDDLYVGTTVNDAAFEVHTYRVAVDASLERLIQVTAESEERERELEIRDRVDIYQNIPQPLRWERATPRYCWLEEQNSAGVHYLGIYPVPDDPMLLKVRYEKSITNLSADGDTSDIPGADATILAYAMFVGMSYKGGKRSPQMQVWQNRYEMELQRLMVSVRRNKRKTFRREDTTGAARYRTVRDANLGPWYPR